jgi:YebC/PmpR family DNA-binding regulatory protein
MSGHSHWATIKRKKGAVDAKKGREFSRVAKVIMAAARTGGGDPDMNLALRYAIDDARAVNMPKDNIERAIKKGTGELEGVRLEEIVYEGYGPGGVALLIETLTDNRNRTAPEIRRLFENAGGSLAGPGSVAWMFDKKGVIAVARDGVPEDRLMEIVLEAGAEDMQTLDDLYEITCEPSAFSDIRTAIKDAGIAVESAEVTNVAKQNVTPEGGDAKRVLRLMESLEDHDDVQTVSCNFEITPEMVEELTT